MILLIGFNKTGTRSFHQFFLQNKITSVHWDNGKWNEILLNNHRSGKKIFDGYENIEAWTDIGFIQRHFEIIAEQYPNALFILNWRPLEKWIFSRKNHYSSQQLREIFLKKYNLISNHVSLDAFWRSEWLLHNRKVSEYFQGVHSNRLLKFSLGESTGEDIKNFLENSYSITNTNFGTVGATQKQKCEYEAP